MQNTAAVLLNYNTWEETIYEIQLLESVKGISSSDIIVIDNCSPNDSYQQLLHKQNEFGYQLYLATENGGYAKGNNIGIKIAQEQGYRYAWILNNDILFRDENLLLDMEEIFRRDERIAVVNPDIYSVEGRLYNRDSIRPSIWDMTFGMISYKKKGRRIIDNGGYGYVYRPQGCCMLLDIEKISKVGYLDENTFLYFEELILAEKLLDSNYLCACAINKEVIHNHSKTVKSNIKKRYMIKINNKSFKYYLSRYRKFKNSKINICILFNTIKWYILD